MAKMSERESRIAKRARANASADEREQFRREAALRAMGALIPSYADDEDGRMAPTPTFVTEWALAYANRITEAVFGPEGEDDPQT